MREMINGRMNGRKDESELNASLSPADIHNKAVDSDVRKSRESKNQRNEWTISGPQDQSTTEKKNEKSRNKVFFCCHSWIFAGEGLPVNLSVSSKDRSPHAFFFPSDGRICASGEEASSKEEEETEARRGEEESRRQ